MKWFKHMCNSISDPFVYSLVKKYNGNGYFVYFGLLEILGEQNCIDKYFVTNFDYLEHRFQLEKNVLIEILNFIAENKKIVIKAENNKNKISIFCPKFMEFSDEWTRRSYKLRSHYGVTTEELRHEENRIEEKRRDKKRSRREVEKKRKDILSAEKTADMLEIEKYFCEKVKEKYGAPYALDYGKDRRLIKTMLTFTDKNKLKSIIDRFLDEPNYADCHTIGVLKTQINKLLQKSARNDSMLPSADEIIKKTGGTNER